MSSSGMAIRDPRDFIWTKLNLQVLRRNTCQILMHSASGSWEDDFLNICQIFPDFASQMAL